MSRPHTNSASGYSNPSPFPEETVERGGWIIKRGDWCSVERWPVEPDPHLRGRRIPVPDTAPEALDSSFHTHPNLGPDEVPSASPYDRAIIGHGTHPHYIDILSVHDDGTRSDVEMQVDNRGATEKRALYHWARVYRDGLGRGDDFADLPWLRRTL